MNWWRGYIIVDSLTIEERSEEEQLGLLGLRWNDGICGWTHKLSGQPWLAKMPLIRPEGCLYI
jgi:hypothetical protein